MAGNMLNQLEDLLRRFAVWFFGLFARLAAYFDDSAAFDHATALKNVVTINTRQHWDLAFEEAEREGKEGILAYFTKWSSPPCKFVRPWFAELSEKYSNLKFLMVYVEDLEELAVEAGVKFIPEFQFFHEGKTEKVQGAKRDQVEALLKRKIGHSMVQRTQTRTIEEQSRSKKAN
ncbi:hypothetical protein KFL_008590010 [Klebsormidium nitens]|uniref:Thioredoxin domain-containing protein n=1 Tax=Klebsormidium nitens TaxID=105231 RepID=A0A1Y1ILY1_KLENI|nr:hypothetical protein KFL_008590010 [Klebsormidium nitens]|eukprot:GAQ91804.1 hypothetical protein KFL_008590010 [Klebsormidium nitens]